MEELLADLMVRSEIVTLLTDVPVTAVVPPLTVVSEPSLSQSAPSLNPPSRIVLLARVSDSLYVPPAMQHRLLTPRLLIHVWMFLRG